MIFGGYVKVRELLYIYEFLFESIPFWTILIQRQFYIGHKASCMVYKLEWYWKQNYCQLPICRGIKRMAKEEKDDLPHQHWWLPDAMEGFLNIRGLLCAIRYILTISLYAGIVDRMIVLIGKISHFDQSKGNLWRKAKSTQRSKGWRSSIGSSETVRETSCSKWNLSLER